MGSTGRTVAVVALVVYSGILGLQLLLRLQSAWASHSADYAAMLETRAHCDSDPALQRKLGRFGPRCAEANAYMGTWPLSRALNQTLHGLSPCNLLMCESCTHWWVLMTTTSMGSLVAFLALFTVVAALLMCICACGPALRTLLPPPPPSRRNHSTRGHRPLLLKDSKPSPDWHCHGDMGSKPFDKYRESDRGSEDEMLDIYAPPGGGHGACLPQGSTWNRVKRD